MGNDLFQRVKTAAGGVGVAYQDHPINQGVVPG